MVDSLKFEKERAIARFNRLRAVMRLWQIIQVAIIFAAISWCSPALVRSTGVTLFEFSTYAFNHHVVFLIGNAIIVSLFMLCRQSATSASSSVGRRDDIYDDYVKYSEAARAMPSPRQAEEDVATAAEFGGGGDKQIVAPCAEETVVGSQCEDVTKVIEKAGRQIRRFQRTHSETLRREIAVRRELRRSDTESRRKTVSSEAAEIENLSSEEFRRRVDAFIDEHWSKRAAKLEGNENCRP